MAGENGPPSIDTLRTQRTTLTTIAVILAVVALGNFVYFAMSLVDDDPDNTRTVLIVPILICAAAALMQLGRRKDLSAMIRDRESAGL